MSFTRKHYVEVARIIREESARCARPGAEESLCAVRNIGESIARMFAADNPRFDANRFAIACAPKREEK